MTGERGVTFDCGGDPLVGILHVPLRNEPRRRGVVMVVGGGPQYRAGGHRQMTLWSRRLAIEGYAVLRFDYRGVGDSYGTFRGYKDVADDIRAAIDCLLTQCPWIDEVVLWGECDAAAAILFYAPDDSRVGGAVLLNPWARTAGGEARTILRFYYIARIFQPSFWKKLLTLHFDPLDSARSALELIRRVASEPGPQTTSSQTPDVQRAEVDADLPRRLFDGMNRFNGRTLVVLSGHDLIAREFEQLADSPRWQRMLRSKQSIRHCLSEADHTFSSKAQRDQVIDWSIEWLGQW